MSIFRVFICYFYAPGQWRGTISDVTILKNPPIHSFPSYYNNWKYFKRMVLGNEVQATVQLCKYKPRLIEWLIKWREIIYYLKMIYFRVLN